MGHSYCKIQDSTTLAGRIQNAIDDNRWAHGQVTIGAGTGSVISEMSALERESQHRLEKLVLELEASKKPKNCSDDMPVPQNPDMPASD